MGWLDRSAQDQRRAHCQCPPLCFPEGRCRIRVSRRGALPGGESPRAFPTPHPGGTLGPDREARGRPAHPTRSPPLSMPIRVLASVIERENRLRVCRRPLDKRNGGLGEFPGGKEGE